MLRAQTLHHPVACCALVLTRGIDLQLCYVSRYDGSFRGVLINFGQEQLGHFPLGLFDEHMKQPAPLAAS